MNSPYQLPREPSPRGPSWSTLGFFVGIGLFFISIPFVSVIGWFAFPLGLLAAVFFGIINQKFGFVSGFIAGLFIGIGLLFLALIILCGHGMGHGH